MVKPPTSHLQRLGLNRGLKANGLQNWIPVCHKGREIIKWGGGKRLILNSCLWLDIQTLICFSFCHCTPSQSGSSPPDSALELWVKTFLLPVYETNIGRPVRSNENSPPRWDLHLIAMSFCGCNKRKGRVLWGMWSIQAMEISMYIRKV